MLLASWCGRSRIRQKEGCTSASSVALSLCPGAPKNSPGSVTVVFERFWKNLGRKSAAFAARLPRVLTLTRMSCTPYAFFYFLFARWVRETYGAIHSEGGLGPPRSLQWTKTQGTTESLQKRVTVVRPFVFDLFVDRGTVNVSLILDGVSQVAASHRKAFEDV